MHEDLLTIKQLPFGKSKLYVDIKAGSFPAPIKIGRRSFWLKEEVRAWLQQRKAARDASRAGRDGGE